MKRTWITAGIMSAILLLLTVLSLKCGTMDVSWTDLIKIFTAPDSPEAVIIRELRLVRTMAAVLSGAALAISGVILQKIMRNDLASPDLLGISSGAGCAGIATLLLFPAWANMLNAAAFAGALLAALLICLAAWKRNLSPVRLILAGVALSAIFSTITGAMILVNSEKLTGIMEFSLGGFSSRTMDEFLTAVPFFLASFIFALFLPRRLELLALGKDEAAAFGLAVEKSRIFAIFTAALAAATAVSLAGLLGFTGLMAPHIAGKLIDSRWSGKLLICAPLTGSILTLSGDLAGRILFAPRELPAGLFLSGAGAIFFLFLLMRERSRI